MSLQSEVLESVSAAAVDACEEARKNWQNAPDMYRTAMLSGHSQTLIPDGAACEMVFEVNPQKVPRAVRDMYGISCRTAASVTKRPVTERDKETLMQKMSDALEHGFIDSIERQMR